MEKSLPRMNDNPLYLICFEFSKCSGWFSHQCNLLHLMGPKLYIPLGTKGLGINMICMSLMLRHSHWHLYKFVDFQRAPLKKSFIHSTKSGFLQGSNHPIHERWELNRERFEISQSLGWEHRESAEGLLKLNIWKTCFKKMNPTLRGKHI